MSVCAFFSLLIIVIIGVFLFVIINIRKDPSTEATIKALTESNNTLQRQIIEQTTKMNDQLMTQMLSSPKQPPTTAQISNELTASLQKREAELAEMESRLKAQAEEIRIASDNAAKLQEKQAQERENSFKQREKQIAEQEKRIKEMEEKLKAAQDQEEAQRKKRELIEQRKKLYPEYFDENGVEHSTPVAKKPEPKSRTPKAEPKKSVEIKNDDDDKFLQDLDLLLNEAGVIKSKNDSNKQPVEEPKAEPAKQAKTPQPKPTTLDLGDSSDWVIPLN